MRAGATLPLPHSLCRGSGSCQGSALAALHLWASGGGHIWLLVAGPHSLWPAGASCRRLEAQYLARARALEHVLWTSPLGGHHEQRAAVRAAERAGEAPAV